MRFADKVAVVTGGSNGFGAATVRRLAADGARVVVFDLTSPESDVAAFVTLDVADAAAWAFAVDEVVRSFGRIDVLVNNAGINVYPAAHEIEMDDWNRAVAVNQTGVMLGLRNVLPGMLSCRSGAIVNVSSTLGTVAVAGAVAYHATKGAVSQLTRNAAISYAAQGVRVNEVLPGICDTRLVRGQAREFTEAGLARTPMGRLGRPEEVANAIAFLASDEASFVTGASLAVDGGYLAQ